MKIRHTTLSLVLFSLKASITFPVGVPGSPNRNRDKLGVSGVLMIGVTVPVWLNRVFLFVGVDIGVTSGLGSGREASRFRTWAVS